MDDSEDEKKEAVPPKHRRLRSHGVGHRRPVSPEAEPSHLSLKSDFSRGMLIEFRDGSLFHQKPVSPEAEPSHVSLKSNCSRDMLIEFRDGSFLHQKPVSPEAEPSHVSLKSDCSRDKLIDFRDGSSFNQKPVSPEAEPSHVSLKSNCSRDRLIEFRDGSFLHQKPVSPEAEPEPSHVSLKSNCSRDMLIEFRDGSFLHQKPVSPEAEPSHVLLKSDCSRGMLIEFRDRSLFHQKPVSPEAEPSHVSLKSDCSRGMLIEFRDLKVDQQISEPRGGQSVQQHQTTFKRLREYIVTFVDEELKQMEADLSSDYLECFEEEEEEDEQRRSSKEAFVKITQYFLRRKMDEQELADHLQSRSQAAVSQRNLKNNLKRRFQCVFEGVPKAGNLAALNQIYTELYVTEGKSADVNDEHEVRQIEESFRKPASPKNKIIGFEDIFKPQTRPVRTVVTKGVAGIGKTILTQKFILDWAEDKANHDIQFLFPFTFRQLNVLREKECSLVELIHRFFVEIKEAGICRFDEFQVVFIFHSLDECRLPLDFTNNETLTDVNEPAPVDVLLTNLIMGNLLPSARLWITTRPAAANQIPPECVGMVTEVRGFTDKQKDEYFRKRFRDEEQADRIMAHVKTCQSLHIMCYIPVFCWITATVMEDVLRTRAGRELPKTLTEMYIHFLVVQCKLKNIKYDGEAETDSVWSPETRKMIESLGKLAFKQLQKGNLIFYESDLTECCMDIRAASVYSGVFTQIFREKRGLYQDKVFCFVHLSVQEFLAALHVHLTFINSGVNLLSEEQETSQVRRQRKKGKPAPALFYRSAVDKALRSPNRHLDLFLRFLLGLSLRSNRAHLRGLLTDPGSSQTSQDTVAYIQERIEAEPCPERSINLFHCLIELNDCSLVEEIQQSLRSGRLLVEKLSPARRSALVFVLLSSEKDLEVFDLKKYSASEEALLALLPVVRASKKAVLSGCNLSERSCEALSSVLSSQSCSLTELDLSDNPLRDSGVKLLSAGLMSPSCTLEALSLSGCQITDEGFASLASALMSSPPHLRELHLSHNRPGESGVNQLSAALQATGWRLDRVEPGGGRWLRSV